LKSYLEKATDVNEALLDQQLQETAFRLVMQQTKCTLVKQVIDTFQIHKIRNELVDLIMAYVSRGQFKEVSSWKFGSCVLIFNKSMK